MSNRELPNKLNRSYTTNETARTPTRFQVSVLMISLSFLVGGGVHKALDASRSLNVGDVFFTNMMAAGFIPVLIAAGVLVVLRQRILNNIIWLTTTTVGLCLISMSGGYFEVYGW